MYIADLHIHSRFSRATSKDGDLPHLDWWARRKGIRMVGTGDFTHPAWRAELREQLVPAGEGVYTLRQDLRLPDVAPGEAPRFVITGEISCIYKRHGRTRKVHNLILLPSLEAADELSARLEAIGNIHSDGRPILGLDSRDLLELVAEQEPDLIAVTGDLIDQEGQLAMVPALARGLAAIAPTYYVTGNHEWAVGGVPALKEILTANGVTVLSNQFVPLERNGDTIVLAGIDDPNGYADQKTPEELAAEVYAACGDPFWILLAHRNNRFARQYSLLGADLVCSGHAHGGIVRLPGTDGLFSHDLDLFPSYTAGLYEENGSVLFVTRGLGNSGPSFRVFNRPEIAVLTLRRAEG